MDNKHASTIFGMIATLLTRKAFLLTFFHIKDKTTMTQQSLPLSASTYRYLQAHAVRENSVLHDLRTVTMEQPGATMQISPEQGQFMHLLVELIAAKKVLELGTFTGYSALWMALALPAAGKLMTCDVDERATNIAQTYWEKAGVAEKIELRLAPALETLDALIVNQQQDTFDFAFIDADKRNYIAYYEKILPLLRAGGLLVIDNVLWEGRVADQSQHDPQTAAIRALNKRIYDDERVSMVMLPVSDGITLVRKR